MDIPNTFIQNRIKDEKNTAIIKIRGVLVDILPEIAPYVYGPYIITNRKGFEQIIAQCQKSIYGTMAASLLYCKNFRNSIEYEGY